MSKPKWMILVVLSGALAAGGCSKAKKLLGAVAEETGAGTTAKDEPALIEGNVTGPAQIQWERNERPGIGSVEIPTGEGWEKSPGAAIQVQHEALDITVMVQQQAGIPADARSEYLSSLIDVNKRDAPKYEVLGNTEGQVNQHPAGRVDGKFDNGTAYATRDYVLFVKNAALAIMVRGPLDKSADVKAIADRMALSFQ